MVKLMEFTGGVRHVLIGADVLYLINDKLSNDPELRAEVTAHQLANGTFDGGDYELEGMDLAPYNLLLALWLKKE